MLSNWLNGVLALVVGAAVVTVMLIVVSGCQVIDRRDGGAEAPILWRK